MIPVSVLLASIAAHTASWPGATPIRISPDAGCAKGAPFEARVARTAAERSVGLSGRSEPLASGEAMLFAFDAPVRSPFWMKETLIPLTILFFDSSSRLVSAQEMGVEGDPARPARLYAPDVPYVAAVEIAAGQASRFASAPAAYLCVEP